MQPITHIRKHVFRESQTGFARIAGVDQSTVSRWETGKLAPNGICMQRIRDAARARGIDWRDAWFFEVPASEAAT